VFNLRWSVLWAAFGFVLSLALSLVSGAGVSSFVRAVSFGVGFFVMASFLYWLVKQFLPELLSSEDDELQDMGSQVDISLDDDTSSLAAILGEEPGEAFQEDGGLAIDGIESLKNGGFPVDEFDFQKPGDSVSGGDSGGILDQDDETGYTNKDTVDRFEPFGSPQDYMRSLGGGIPGEGGSTKPLSGNPSQSVSEAALPAGGTDVLDVLPDQDGLSQTFLSSFGDDSVSGAGQGTPVSVNFPGVERNRITLEGASEEFRGKEKESALAIQTILKRD
jgi:hypothetical protein